MYRKNDAKGNVQDEKLPGEKRNEQPSKKQITEEKEQIKLLADKLQEMCERIGAPISLSVSPLRKSKCITLFDQAQFGSEFDSEYYFMYVRLAPKDQVNVARI